MKLQTSILPRRDGTVRHTAKDGKKTYVFQAGPDGELVCDVDDETEVAALLKTDLFYPADPEDYDQALALTGKSFDGESLVGGTGNELGPGNDDDDDDDKADPNALPLEANTPPAAAPKKSGGKKGK